MNTTDDRGRIVQLMRISRQLLRQPILSPLRITEAQQKRTHELYRKDSTILGLALTGGVAILFVGGILAAMPAFAIVPVLAAATIFMLWLAARRSDRIESIHFLPAQFICPACAHSLRGLPPEPDGCLVCPECGAAWRRPENPALVAIDTSPSPINEQQSIELKRFAKFQFRASVANLIGLLFLISLAFSGPHPFWQITAGIIGWCIIITSITLIRHRSRQLVQRHSFPPGSTP